MKKPPMRPSDAAVPTAVVLTTLVAAAKAVPDFMTVAADIANADIGAWPRGMVYSFIRS
jgi:hypothetical protein